ncbi:hypothetical protein H112_04274 [Trichophyton rubrum D6]|uniref:Uncharacterized protein n=3 Tax=Trichophyton TaxID=5550 RepID=A0A080WJ23_TRIRC|nr:uncharacterized protein TERG_12095 [Trichophyton rubrum CBS 118892]XP_047606161.1 uncharacterized protein TERG_12095 [Trichophyton rubrum CBS 118892]EZF22765.1 hypothetical protein H100_04281 [Trichophyton rubrum MR850]EZF42017.1 hypothetical protein H102_04266 [Trichophyton rubrum CBS 100081]EZF52627.1 hypothetical protein H103_04274 [Trichophyton rubrum CBS 288.86]EZF63223.1 hypothetical protein H104_04264 [Trichophyton rubrum CBS 289.86]EZF73956.1 hypothetical protein H105_04291 [Tricho
MTCFPLPFFFFRYPGFRSHQHAGIMFSAIDLGRTEHEPKERVSSLMSPRMGCNEQDRKIFLCFDGIIAIGSLHLVAFPRTRARILSSKPILQGGPCQQRTWSRGEGNKKWRKR